MYHPWKANTAGDMGIKGSRSQLGSWRMFLRTKQNCIQVQVTTIYLIKKTNTRGKLIIHKHIRDMYEHTHWLSLITSLKHISHKLNSASRFMSELPSHTHSLYNTHTLSLSLSLSLSTTHTLMHIALIKGALQRANEIKRQERGVFKELRRKPDLFLKLSQLRLGSFFFFFCSLDLFFSFWSTNLFRVLDQSWREVSLNVQ